MDRIIIAIPRLHSMQRFKNEYGMLTLRYHKTEIRYSGESRVGLDSVNVEAQSVEECMHSSVHCGFSDGAVRTSK